jgi:Glycoside hydrolase family 44
LVLASILAVGCSAGGDADPADGDTADSQVLVRVDTSQPGAPISPLILGHAGELDAAQMADVGMTFSSWGGNPSTRYNYTLGNAFNNARDWEYRNTDYGTPAGDSFRRAATLNTGAGIEMRLAVPTLGWVARDGNVENCSFPDGDGGCAGAGDADCSDPGPIADPTKTSVPSTPEMVSRWVADLLAEGFDISYIAMDNEPELWGSTHYDVHPECSTYEEILQHYLDYARAVREVAPDAKLMGPVICCWFDYWHTAPGPADGSGAEFLPWFLSNVRAHDEKYGRRTLDVVDVHYYPQSDVYNEETDPETNARRLRSTRALWDPTYVDESWIGEPIAFIPRTKAVIEASYPGTPLAITEWNFGADTTMNGALAIADVLGIYGREGVYAAAYWRSPPAGSPGYFAFKMHGNYDDHGSRFAGAVAPVDVVAEDRVSAFAAVDKSAELVRVMLINKDPDRSVDVELTVDGAAPAQRANSWTYAEPDLSQIVAGSVDAGGTLTLRAASITVLELRD